MNRIDSQTHGGAAIEIADRADRPDTPRRSRSRRFLSDRGRATRAAIATFAVGIALLAGVGAAVLTQAPIRTVRIGAPGVKAVSALGANGLDVTVGDLTVCQAHEVLPRGVTAIRLSIWAFFGTRIHLMAYSGSRLLTEGRRNAAWTSTSVTVPVRPLNHTTSGVRLCFAIGPNSEPQLLLGVPKGPLPGATISNGIVPAAHLTAKSGSSLTGRVAIEYLAPSHRSWWSRVLSVARRLGLGRAYSGTWIALLIAALMAAVGVLAVRLTLRELR